MRARYYNPAMRRFVNADILAGSLYNFVILNRYAYADCNPAMCVDPLGLSAEERDCGYKADNEEFNLFNFWNAKSSINDTESDILEENEDDDSSFLIGRKLRLA